MRMSEVELEEKASARFVRHRILHEWRDDIEVLEVTERRRRLIGRKQILVEIGCSSPIAFEQARISLAAVVENDASDWDVPRSAPEEHSKLPFRIRLIEPRPEKALTE
jgi:hypothetical protein